MAATAKGELLLRLTHTSLEEVIAVTHQIATYTSGKKYPSQERTKAFFILSLRQEKSRNSLAFIRD